LINSSYLERNAQTTFSGADPEYGTVLIDLFGAGSGTWPFAQIFTTGGLPQIQLNSGNGTTQWSNIIFYSGSAPYDNQSGSIVPLPIADYIDIYVR
jgi:hypothetical protein